jgi:TonB family protein
MRAYWAIALFVGLGTSFSGGQQATTAPSSPVDAQPARVKVYDVGRDVTAPELLPASPFPILDEKCKKKEKTNDIVVLSVLVDTAGKPRNIMFLRPLGSDVDRFAFEAVAADRFKPGTHEGIPVVVAQAVKVDLQACNEEKKDEAGKKISQLRLRAQPVQRLEALPEPPKDAVLTPGEPSWNDPQVAASRVYHGGKGVSAPVSLNIVAAEFTDAARKARHEGIVLVSCIVDVQGRPQDFKVIRTLGMGLDEKAVEAVGKYRFKPAMKNGEPVPVRITVEVNFRLYERGG